MWQQQVSARRWTLNVSYRMCLTLLRGTFYIGDAVSYPKRLTSAATPSSDLQISQVLRPVKYLTPRPNKRTSHQNLQIISKLYCIYRMQLKPSRVPPFVNAMYGGSSEVTVISVVVNQISIPHNGKFMLTGFHGRFVVRLLSKNY